MHKTDKIEEILTDLFRYGILSFVEWQYEATDLFLRRAKKYAKKHPLVYSKVLANLDRYREKLCEGHSPKLFFPGFLHPEPRGIYAIAQIDKNLPETRLYIYPHAASDTLFLLNIGGKSTQPKDIKEAVDALDLALNEKCSQ